MDELNAFFNAGGSSKPKRLQGSVTSRVSLVDEDISTQMQRRKEHRSSASYVGSVYGNEARQREVEQYVQNESEFRKAVGTSKEMDALEKLSSMMSINEYEELTPEVLKQTYRLYTKKEKTKILPIDNSKKKIMELLHSQPVVIIEGPTGCGKSTQVPQWILEDCYERCHSCKIVVTQPRRIAAVSIAKRVAHERGVDVGGLVGYQVGLENNLSNDTKIEYVTTGVLLQKLIAAKTLRGYTHIIVDEIHERDQDMDFLLLVVKKLLYSNSINVKVVLMSATFNVITISDYFAMPTLGILEPATCIKVQSSKASYVVNTYYLNSLSNFFNFPINCMQFKEPGVTKELNDVVIKLLNFFDPLEKGEKNDRNSVLIFLPGIHEIEELYNLLTDMDYKIRLIGEEGAKSKWWVLPLHSTITVEEQSRVFQTAPSGVRKIILTTNVAESSITVPDVKYVIDYCLMKVLVADPKTNFTSLQLQWASKTNCEQRGGRVGRVADGRIFRLVPITFYRDLNQETAPEIQRCPLDRLVLLSKMLNMGPPADILALAITPPDLSNIHRTILVLKEMGCLKKTVDGKVDPLDGDITYMGRICSKLPIDIRMSKLIVLGYMFGCLEDCVIIAASMSVKHLFSNPFQERLNSYMCKLSWANGSTSDCIAFLNIYKLWTHFKHQQYFMKSDTTEEAWARHFFVQLRSLKELYDLVIEIRRRLSREGIDSIKDVAPMKSSELSLMLKVLIAGAFYPHYFIQGMGDEEREKDAAKVLDGLDPRTTVYLKNFPMDQPGPIYAKTLKNYVRHLIGEDTIVTFSNNSNKVLLTFTDDSHNPERQVEKFDPTIPGKVLLPVYKAVKARHLKINFSLGVLPKDKAHKLAEALTSANKERIQKRLVPRLPEIDETIIPIKISQFINCGRFWAQYDDESTFEDLKKIDNALNGGPLLSYTDALQIGEMYAASYQDQSGMRIYRVRVEKILDNSMVWVFYLDYGSFGRVNMKSVYVLPKGICWEVQPLAMECLLAEVSPSVLMDVHGHWTKPATRLFQELIKNARLYGKIYSVYYGVVAIELLANSDVSVNQELVNRGYAQAAEESYESKFNHDLRETAIHLNMAQKRAFNKHQTENALASQYGLEIDAPSIKDATSEVRLQGPNSPLETVVYPLMHGILGKQVTIEGNSVNSVLLDSDPQLPCERLVVACEIGQSQDSERLTLRHTTLMPPVPGLPALVAMLFCPMLEMRRDTSKQCYVSILCGLGADEKNYPMFSEHDILMNIDSVVDIEDISNVNYIRHMLDYMMVQTEQREQLENADSDIANMIDKVRQQFRELICKRRPYRDTQSPGNNVAHAWDWNSVPQDELLQLEDPTTAEWECIFPLHTPLGLVPIEREELLKLYEENNKLKRSVIRTSAASNMQFTCELCGSNPMSLQTMRIHLYSQTHRNRELPLAIFENK